MASFRCSQECVLGEGREDFWMEMDVVRGL